MIIILSPSKTLDYLSQPPIKDYTIPEFLNESEKLIKLLKKETPSGLSKLMEIIDKLAILWSNQS